MNSGPMTYSIVAIYFTTSAPEVTFLNGAVQRGNPTQNMALNSG